MRRRNKIVFFSNLTPMIDLIFTLLIFFVVTTQFVNSNNVIEVNLPQATTSVTTEATSLDVIIDKNNNIYLNNKKVSIVDFESRIIEIAGSKISPVIRADSETNYGIVIKVMDILRKYGFTNIDLSVKKQEK
jgi:biopolymer transport protein ExbD